MLISKSDVIQFSQLSQNAKNDLVDLFILDSELMDLKPLLGELLYQDMVDNIAEDKYEKLLNGTTYTYNEQSYTTQGVKPVLSKFTYAKYVLTSSQVDTGFGIVQKNDQNSNASDFSMKKTINKLYYQQGYEYFKSVRDYLNRNEDIYPLWNSDCSKTQRTFKINKII